MRSIDVSLCLVRLAGVDRCVVIIVVMEVDRDLRVLAVLRWESIVCLR